MKRSRSCRVALASFAWLAAAVVATALPVGCASDQGTAHSASSAPIAAPEPEPAELGPMMSETQHNAQKLGYAIQGRNPPLARFYVDEVKEVIDEVHKTVPVKDKWPIAKLIELIATPAIASVDRSLKSGDWSRTDKAYADLIYACNRCHAATQHEFLVITVPAGEPPFNQRFKPGPPVVPKSDIDNLRFK
jgi:hypothetical protein